MDSKISSASYEGKSTWKMPKGAKLIRKDYNVRVEEIENGFLVCKSYDVEYQTSSGKDYGHFQKKWFSEENPLKMEMDDEKYLADNF